jgi:hypothetical protein
MSGLEARSQKQHGRFGRNQTFKAVMVNGRVWVDSRHR